MLDRSNLGITRVERLHQKLVHYLRIVTLHEIGMVAASNVESPQILVARPRLHRRGGDLVSVEMQDR